MERILRGSAKYLELKGGLRNPDYLMLNLPFSCNYHCLKCCNSNRKQNASRKPLSLDEIVKLMHGAKALGSRVLVIAGEGEPLLNKDFFTIVEKADSLGMIPYVFTNGSLLNQKTLMHLRRHNASLVINLDSLKKKNYEELCGAENSFNKVMRNLELARKIFSDTFDIIGNYSIRRIAVNTVFSSQPREDLEAIRRFCGDDFVWVCNTPMHIGRANFDHRFSKPYGIGTSIIESQIPLGTVSDGSWCAYMRNGISIGADGSILTCAYSLESGGLLGNVRRDELSKYIEQANKVVDRFYRIKGHSRCILRHPEYKAYIDFLRDHNGK